MRWEVRSIWQGHVAGLRRNSREKRCGWFSRVTFTSPKAHARDEAEVLVRALGESGQVLAGSAASEQALKRIDLDAYKVLLLATHAVVDDTRPERSAVLLAAGGEGEDGMLQVREIAGLGLRDYVVVLSACRGASGPVVGGEGVLGLARAFLAAGARTVVANRWPYRDDHAAALTQALAREIEQGATVGDALTAARRAQFRAGAPAMAWAGMMLIGDGAMTLVPGGKSSGQGLRFGALLVLASVVVWILWIARVRARRRSSAGKSIRE